MIMIEIGRKLRRIIGRHELWCIVRRWCASLFFLRKVCRRYSSEIGRTIRAAEVGTALIIASAFGSAAQAQDSFADPAGSGAIIGAMRWLQSTLLGTVATVAAVIAVASVGLLMLTGRVNWRHGATVILGCFIIFGAASIVGGIQTAAGIGY